LSNPDKIEIKEPIIYKCLNCDKTYQYASGLSKHKNNCKSSTEIIVKNENISDKELINKLLDTIKEQSATMKEMIPKLGNTTNTTNNNISLITYLNTECKDAMNLTDFINNIKHTLQDALFTIDNGLVNGLTKALIDNLNQLPKIQRPIWCADVKRKKNIIKDDNKWIEDKENKKIKLALTNIQQKQGIEFNKSYLKPIETYNDKDKERWIKGMKILTDDIPDKTIDILIKEPTIHPNKK
jgi:translation initiation factor 2B subunit (eIF-2B alpha/beta/delta family)